MAERLRTPIDIFNKQICDFIVRYYIEDNLKMRVNADQLKLSLMDGTAILTNVSVNAEALSETLKVSRLPLTVIDGYVKQIKVVVPLKSILTHPIMVEVDGFELTVEPSQIDLDSTETLLQPEMTASFYNSMSSSITSPMDLARSYIDKGVAESEELVEAFAEIIDRIAAMVCVSFRNIVVRVEVAALPSCGLMTCLEMRIDRISYADERQQNFLLETDALISEPQQLSAIPDLNKIIRLSGITLYTDIFSKPNLADNTGMKQNECLPSEPGLESSQIAASKSSEGHNLSSISSNDSFYTALNQSYIVDDKPNKKIGLSSSPILFASFCGENQRIVVRMKNKRSQITDSSSNPLDISCFFGNLKVFASPSQLYIFAMIINKLLIDNKKKKENEFGYPMTFEHYQIVEDRLRDLATASTSKLPETGNWQGEPVFYEYTNKTTKKGKKEISMDPLAGSFREESIEERLAKDEQLLSLKLTLDYFLLIVTHDDSVSKRVSNKCSTEELIDNVGYYQSLFQRVAKDFFDTIGVMDFTTFQTGNLNRYNSGLDSACAQDHLRFVASKFILHVSSGAELSSVKLSASNLSVAEVLTSGSTVKMDKKLVVDIFRFKDGVKKSEKPNLFIDLLYDTVESECQLNVDLSPSRFEIDVSMIDRISSLILMDPFFKRYANFFEGSSAFSTRYYTDAQYEPTTSLSVNVNCPLAVLDLRIPVADLRSVENELDRPRYWMRNVHKEILRLKLNNFNAKLPKFSMNKFLEQGKVALEMGNLAAYFFDEGTDSSEKLFLFAYKSAEEKISISVKLSIRAHSLSLDKEVRRVTKSPTDLLFQLDVVDGPFAKNLRTFEGKVLRAAGTRREILNFGEECSNTCLVKIGVIVPSIHMYLPSHEFYELLYNRLVNNFMMWKPSSPDFIDGLFSSKKIDSCDIEAERIFYPCYSSFQEDAEVATGEDSDEKLSNTEAPTKISAQMEVKRLIILLGTETLEKEEDGSERIVPNLLQLSLIRNCLGAFIGFHGKSEESYFYVTSKAFDLSGKGNGDEVREDLRLLHGSFGIRGKCQEYMKRAKISDLFSSRMVDDDNFAASLRVIHKEAENIKDILGAIAIRNTLFSLDGSINDLKNFWIMQLSKFFNVTEQNVAGYNAPGRNKEIHFSFNSCVLSLMHQSEAGEKLDFRLLLDSLDLKAEQLEYRDACDFSCLVENAILYMMKIFEGATRQTFTKFAQLTMFFIEFRFSNLFSEKCLDIDVPFVELKCKNNLLEVWACSDALVAFTNMMKEIFSTKSSVESCDNNTNEKISQNDHLSLAMLEQSVLDLGIDSSFLDVNSQDIKDSEKFVMDKQHLENVTDISCDRPERVAAFKDEEFVILEDIPGSGILGKHFEPKVRYLNSDSTREPETINVIEYFHPKIVGVSSGDAKFMDPTKRSSVPLIKVQFTEFSLLFHMFGGDDFNDGNPREKKPYSLIDNDAAAAFSFLDSDNAFCSPYRDGSVRVDISLSKMHFLHQIFSLKSLFSQTSFFTISTAEIYDNLATSKFKMMLHSYKKSNRPSRLNAPMLAFRLAKYHNNRGKVSLSMLPIRLNIDQDTLEFIQDYFDAFFTKRSENDDTRRKASFDDSSLFETSDEFLCVKTESEKTGESFPSEPSCSNVADEDENKPVDSEEKPDEKLKSIIFGAETLYKEVTFSPSVVIQLDYQGKRVRAEQGVLLGLLIGLMNLQCTELKLEDFENREGLVGLESCLEFAINYWIQDIREKQLSKFVGSYAPIRSLVLLGHGIRDLFFMPVQEYQREDGHVVSGIRRGAQSFGRSTFSASIDIARKMADIVHGVSEFAFDVTTPDSIQQLRRGSQSTPTAPDDIRQGLNLALEAVRQGFSETLTDLQKAVGKDRTDGLWPLRSLLRRAPPAAIRPLVLASKAAGIFLDGVKNQMNPDERE